MRRQVSVAARKFPRLKNEVLTFMLQQAHAKQSKAAHRSKMRPGKRYNRMFSAGKQRINHRIHSQGALFQGAGGSAAAKGASSVVASACPEV
jgi:hypothetical protein